MALPILDGNQSPTTLSTIIVSNAHVPAHTVTSLGTQAITDIATAVSGVELGPNTLNALENITVTMGQVTITGGLTDSQLRASPVTIGGSVTAIISGTPSITFGTAVITGSTSILNFPTTQTIAGTVTANLSNTNLNTVTIGIRGTVTASGLVNAIGADNATQVLGFPIVFNDAIAEQPEFRHINVANPLPVRAILTTVTVGNSVTIGSLPDINGTVMLLGSSGDRIDDGGVLPVYGPNGGNVPISGTVTANLSSVPTHSVIVAAGTAQIGSVTATISGTVPVSGTFYQATQPVSIASLPSLAAGTEQIGSVTASISGTPSVTFGTAVITGSTSIIGTPSVTFTQIATHGVTIGAGTAQIGSVTATISGTVPVSGTFYQATQPVSLASLPSLAAGTSQIGSVTASISGTPTVTMGAISGTVTASVSALPSGALTTRFGSLTTANTSQITTSVTNNSRKYLLAQNISSGTVTIGIGFSPTTTQGIQLIAGAGICFDSFCPTGAVYWLGATTGATWTILEG